MQDKRIEIMKEYSIPRSIIAMAVPSIVGLVTMGFYNMVDTMFVSWIGKEATGAAQVVFPITMILSSIGLALGIGGASFISRLLGEDKKDKANQVCSTNFFLALFMGIIATALSLIFLNPLLIMFGATAGIMNYAKEYGFYILLGGFITILNMTLNNLLRSEGSAKHSMMAMLVGSILNILLDPLLIFGWNLGIKGAAIATTFSQMVSFLILIMYYMNKKSLLHLSVKNIKFEKIVLSEIMKIGSPTFFRQMLVSTSMALLNNITVFYGGETALAAVSIVSRMVLIIMFFVFGLAQGFQPVAGFNYGAKRYDRVLESIWVTIKIGFTFSLIISVIFFLFSRQLLGLFKPEPAVLEIGLDFVKYALISLVLLSLSNVIAILYQAIGRAKAAMILSISSQGLFFIPAIIILPKILGLQGVLIAKMVADLITVLLAFFIFMPTLKSIKNRIDEDKGGTVDYEENR